MKSYILIVTLFIASISFADSRPFRVNQIPNGEKNQCLNCHFSGAGGSLNKFGQEIFSNHLTVSNSSGNVVWSADLANLDSDNDGFSNGVELLDPNGVWKIGLENPDAIENVTNPGNANSFPVSVRDLISETPDGIVTINSINPNPISDQFSLTFQLKNSGYYTIQIFDVVGRLVVNLGNYYYTSGRHSSTYDMSMISGNIQSGSYFLSISSGKSFDFKIINMVK